MPARTAFDENLTHYKQQIPALFLYNALLIVSNGTDSRVGSLTAEWERFGYARSGRGSGHERAKDVRAIDEDVASIPTDQRVFRLFDDLRQICRETIVAAGGEIVA